MFAGGAFAPCVLDGVDLGGARAVCVDGGLAHCLAAGLEPALLVGDLDSVSPAALARAERADVPRLSFPADKDASDLELALHALADGGAGAVPDEVVVVGVSGGRTDHLLFNWQLAAVRPWPFRLRLVDASVDAVLVVPHRPLSARGVPGETLSLLALGRATGVTTRGLRYRLAGATLERGTTRGLSNVVDAGSVSVSVTGGTLLAMRVRSRAMDA